MRDLPTITDQQRNASPAVTPQALAWHHGKLWMGSRDLSRIYVIDPLTWSVVEEHEPPGGPWAAVSDGETLWFTIGVGANDDRYVCRYKPGRGFAPESEWIACPEFAGSYLSYDGANLYLSQWYKHRILQLDRSGTILRTFDVEEEICGHTFVNGIIYLLRGTEAGDESWRVARLDPRAETPVVEDLARVPFACRSLAHDGARFWSNHRAGDAIVSFTLPAA